MTGRLIIASNRIASPGTQQAGGLAVALGDALAERGGGVWFGWSGETVERETRGVRLFAEGNVDYALADLTQAEYEGYYLGYANRALWPVFHYRVDLAHFDEAEFDAYDQVNRRFARLLAQVTRPDDIVWVHDYHFLRMDRPHGLLPAHPLPRAGGLHLAAAAPAARARPVRLRPRRLPDRTGQRELSPLSR